MLHFRPVNNYLTLDGDECRDAARPLAERYQAAEPFPHIVLDRIFDPDVLRQVLAEFPRSDGKKYFDRDQERYKFQFAPHEIESGHIKNLFAELNSPAFLGFLEEMTGIRGLIPDPYFAGGGLHETKRGGHLGVHADFNVHGHLKLQRRLNLLIYLNEEWDPKFGGQLELWDKQMKACVVRVEPLFGRAVIFNTNLDSFHGHPDPLNCPPERSRRSIATYYYTAAEDGLALLPKRTTNFRQRPASADKADWIVRRQHFVNDWVPPKLQRLARRVLR